MSENESDKPLVDDEGMEYQKIVIPNWSDKRVAEAIKKLVKEFGEEEVNRQFAKVGSWGEILRRLSDMNTSQSMFIGEVLESIEDTSMIANKLDVADTEELEGYSLGNKSWSLEKKFGGEELSGDTAKLFILARNNSIKKIYLYNSGFHIVIRSPKLSDLNMVYNRLGIEFTEYGRMMGALFYMYSDLKVKEILIDFIDSITINCNLKQWKGNRLRNAIKIQDYQLILLQAAALMHKDGYPFKHACLKCSYVSETKIDLNLLQLTDFARIPDDSRRWLVSDVVADTKSLKNYQNSLDLSRTIDVGSYRLALKIPSIGEYTKYGNIFNNELSKSIHDLNSMDDVQRYLKFAYCSVYVPWIESVGVIDPDDSTKIDFVVRDEDCIKTVLDEIQNNGLSDEFGDKLAKFIGDTSITNIGYIATPCESCGEVGDNVVNGVVPIDIQNAFFSVMVMRLIQN